MFELLSGLLSDPAALLRTGVATLAMLAPVASVAGPIDPGATPTPAAQVTINRVAQPSVPIPPGRYWYDARSGLWGYEGGHAMGIVRAGLDAPALPADASHGDSGVFLNGRQLQSIEYLYLANLVGYFPPGRYWLDATGKAGPEGGQAAVDVFQAARRATAGSGQGTFYREGALSTVSGGVWDGGGIVSVTGPGGKITSVGF